MNSLHQPAFACVLSLLCSMAIAEETLQPKLPKNYTIPTIDISGETARQVVVALGTDKIYQGHVHTLLMPDGRTIYAAWTIGHGGVCGPMKKSDDGGLTWSELLDVPKDWRTVKNCPTIHRLVDPDGKARLMVFAGNGPMQQAVSEDDGRTWSPMRPNGLMTIVAPITIEAVDAGARLLMWYHRGSNDHDRSPLTVWQAASIDGGLTWGEAKAICAVDDADPCEPAVVRSPGGKQLLLLMRENRRRLNSLCITSNDEGKTWSAPKELPAALTGDRHMPRYAPDGRLVVVMRDTAAKSPTIGHFVAWVGRYDDIINGREGQYRVKLLHSHAGLDCGYPGLECLPDGTMVATTYIKYRPGPEKHSIVSVRFKLSEIDAANHNQAQTTF